MRKTTSRSRVSRRSPPFLHIPRGRQDKGSGAVVPIRDVLVLEAARHSWPVLRLAEDIIVADRGPWLEFLREATDDEIAYAIRTLQARTRLISAPRVTRARVETSR